MKVLRWNLLRSMLETIMNTNVLVWWKYLTYLWHKANFSMDQHRLTQFTHLEQHMNKLTLKYCVYDIICQILSFYKSDRGAVWGIRLAIILSEFNLLIWYSAIVRGCICTSHCLVPLYWSVVIYLTGSVC